MNCSDVCQAQMGGTIKQRSEIRFILFIQFNFVLYVDHNLMNKIEIIIHNLNGLNLCG